MSRKTETEEARLQARIARAEKKAMKYAGIDEGLIQRFWELVNMFPKISDTELEARVERFIMNATPGQFFMMQECLFADLTPYMIDDPRVKRLMEGLKGKKLGLCLKGEYESTITIGACDFTVERGIRDGIPVISAESRRDYADSILGLKDPIKMILARKIRATHKLKLLKWGLPHLDLLRDSELTDRLFSHQVEIEKSLDENLKRMGY